MPLIRQLSLFGVEANDPTPEDLAGLLAGPGELSRMGGTARVLVRVDAAWRVHVLVAELTLRDLAAAWESTADSAFVVRTAYTARLVPLAVAWSEPDGGKRPPPGFNLAGPALRLWVAAAGESTPDGFLLRLGSGDAPCWPPVGAALQAVGVAAALLATGAGAPAYRITGRRRLARLAELVGEAPPAAPDTLWPALPGPRRGS